MKKLLILSILTLSFILSGCSSSKTEEAAYPDDAVYTTAPLFTEDEEGLYDMIDTETGTVFVVSPEYLERNRQIFYDLIEEQINYATLPENGEENNISSISYNKDFTEIEINLSSEEAILSDIFSAQMLLNYASTYQQYLLVEEANVVLKVINSNGETIETLTSKMTDEEINALTSKYIVTEESEEATGVEETEE